MKAFVKSPVFAWLWLLVFSLNLIHKIKGLTHIPAAESTAFKVGYFAGIIIICVSIVSGSIRLIQLLKRAGLIKL